MAAKYGLTDGQAQSVQANEESAIQLSDLLERHNVLAVAIDDPFYPEQLRDRLGDKAPPVLFMAGSTHLLHGRAVGFCGARDASEESLRYAGRLAAILAKRSVLIVSGHAQGTDETAHRAALETGGGTVLVLPEGILHFRPRPSLAGLLSDDQFLVVSEFPPKLPWSVGNAMLRNRTICGLVEALVVVEAGTSGGTWEAGQEALRLGIPLFVFDFANPPSTANGNALLVRKGATPLPCCSGDFSDLQPLYDALVSSGSKQPSLF
jgi:DNA protecting protein DprA